ncbi:MAG: four helix bundle protein [Methyloglobulus sp.]|nr:four helix bundle protein [Methyloglobulus sp.]
MDSYKFFYYAKGSCGELRTQIYIGIEIGIISKEIGLKGKDEAEQISKMLSAFIKSRTV